MASYKQTKGDNITHENTKENSFHFSVADNEEEERVRECEIQSI